MNATESNGLIGVFQDLVAQVPDILQPVIVALAGAVPFIEGEGGAAIGIIGGIHPVVAALSAAVGNFLCVAIIVLLGSRVRTAVTSRGAADAPEPSPRRAKFQRAFHRYGTPGVSLLGPLLLPTQFTAAALTTAGVPPRTVLFWQGAAIVVWTSLITLLITGVITAVG